MDGFKTKRTDYQAPLYQGRSARRLFHYWYKFSTKSFLCQTFGYLQIWWEKRSFWSRDFLFWFWDLQLWCFGRRITYCGRKTSCLGFTSSGVFSWLGCSLFSFQSLLGWCILQKVTHFEINWSFTSESCVAGCVVGLYFGKIAKSENVASSNLRVTSMGKRKCFLWEINDQPRLQRPSFLIRTPNT